MSLHHDFPYTAKKLYCKPCKATTLHTEELHDFKCYKCGRKWDDLLISVNMRQSQYGKTRYEGIILSEKPANARDYVTKTFERLDDCLKWVREEAEKLEKVIQ
jgi:tRNA(Ile2) C34 agmatinyltransferase TiaS